MRLDFENGFDEDIINKLNETIGHSIERKTRIANVVAISVENGEVKASYDPKRGGSYVVFDGKY